MPRTVLAAALLAASSCAQAARPLVTDDARVVDAGGCQVESFMRREHGGAAKEFWLLPACNPGSAELTVGSRRVEDSSNVAITSIVQAKTLLRALKPDGSGLALTLGALRERPGDAEGAPWSGYLNGIASHSFGEDRVVLHANLGGLADRAMHRNVGAWAFGAEVAITARTAAIGEMYGQRYDVPSHQLGVRHWFVKDRFQVDGTAGWRHGSAWHSIGIRLLF
jgi:hypothetical protein